MKVVLLGHDDAPSLYALNRLVRALPGHSYEAFVSGALPADEQSHPAMAELEAMDRTLRAAIESEAASAIARRRPLPAPNGPHGLETLRRANPDLVVSIRYRRILKDAAIAIPRRGVLNLHSGILPDYRGVMATFWAMLAGEDEIGCTLHRITDAGIDTGPVIAVCRLARDPAASYLENVLALYRPGVDRIVEAVAALDAGRPVAGQLQPTGAGRYFRAPDATAVEKFIGNNLKLVSGAEKALISRDKPGQ